MKKATLYCTLLFLLLAGAGSSYAQGNMSIIDPRAKNHYTEEQINAMSAGKISQVNFYYSKSFVVLKKDNCNGCPAIDVNILDVTVFENQRAEDRRVVVFLTKPGLPIELLSWNELKAEYAKLSKDK